MSLICPGCEQEVHAAEPHLELTKFGNMESRFFHNSQSIRFHNESCLRTWLGKPVVGVK